MKRQRVQSHKFVLPLIVLFFFMYVGAESATSGWIATYAKATALGNAAFAAYLTSAFWIAITVGRLLSIPLAAHMTPKGVLLIDLVGAVVSISVPTLWPQSNAAVWAGTIGVGLFMASMFPTMVSFAERRLTVTGRVTSWYFVGGSLGGMTLPWLIGQLFESFGPRIMIYGIGLNLVLAFIVFGMLAATVSPNRHQAGSETSRL
jgi:FHS family Na+ dependent glucose MFS transporter 1